MNPVSGGILYGLIMACLVSVFGFIARGMAQQVKSRDKFATTFRMLYISAGVFMPIQNLLKGASLLETLIAVSLYLLVETLIYKRLLSSIKEE